MKYNVWEFKSGRRINNIYGWAYVCTVEAPDEHMAMDKAKAQGIVSNDAKPDAFPHIDNEEFNMKGAI